MAQTTQNSKEIAASPEVIFQAFANPAAVETWMAPGEMTAKVSNFDFKVGGGYEMSLFYPESDQASKGKTSLKEDRYTAKFIEIISNKKMVQAINFDSNDPNFFGEMLMEVIFEPINGSTRVTFLFKNIPIGINPKDNEKGTNATLEKLDKFVTAFN